MSTWLSSNDGASAAVVASIEVLVSGEAPTTGPSWLEDKSLVILLLFFVLMPSKKMNVQGLQQEGERSNGDGANSSGVD